jgi:hypothetical protein
LPDGQRIRKILRAGELRIVPPAQVLCIYRDLRRRGVHAVAVPTKPVADDEILVFNCDRAVVAEVQLEGDIGARLGGSRARRSDGNFLVVDDLVLSLVLKSKLGTAAMKVSMTERFIALAVTLVGAVFIGLSGYALLKLFLSLLLILYGRE